MIRNKTYIIRCIHRFFYCNSLPGDIFYRFNSLSYNQASPQHKNWCCYDTRSEVMFPKRDIFGDDNYLLFGAQDVFFGLDAVNASNDYTYAADNKINLILLLQSQTMTRET